MDGDRSETVDKHDKHEENETFRLLTFIEEIEKRVELLREQALAVEKEKESLLCLLQQIQDSQSIRSLQKADKEDIEFHTERLVVRCLTVEVAVSTPRNESQEEAFLAVKSILDSLTQQVTKAGAVDKQEKLIESYLNACLPEPLTNNINGKFQEKVLGCTADDQKHFRQHLENLLKDVKEPRMVNGASFSGSGSSQNHDSIVTQTSERQRPETTGSENS